MPEGQNWLRRGALAGGLTLAGLIAYGSSSELRQAFDQSTQNVADAFVASLPDYDQLPKGVESHVVFDGQNVDVYRVGSQDYIIAADKQNGGERDVFQALDEMRARCGDIPYDANWGAEGRVVRALVTVPVDKIDCWESRQPSAQS